MTRTPAPHLARRRFALGAVALACTGLLGACGGGGDDNLDDRLGLAEPKLRFVHAVPGGAHVTLLRNGSAETAVTNVAYKFGSPYSDVGAGPQALSLRAVTGNVELATGSVDAKRGTRYT